LVQICENMALDRLAGGELEGLAAYAKSKGVSIQPGTRGVSLEHLRKFLGIALKFGSNIVRTIADTNEHKPGREEIADLLRLAAPEYEKAGVRLALENHDRLSTRDFAWIMKSVRHPSVGICLDTVNSFGSLEGPEIVIERLVEYIVNLHVKDFRIDREPSKMGFRIEGMPAGKGRLDIPGLFAAIAGLDRDVDAILELWTPRQESVEATVKLESEWAEQSVEYLKRSVT